MSERLDRYRVNALLTESPIAIPQNAANSPAILRLVHASLGLFSDLEELTHHTSILNQVEEVGDVLWFLNLGLDAIGRSWSSDAVNEPMRGLEREVLHRIATSPEGQSRAIIREMQREVALLQDALKAVMFYGRTDFKKAKYDLHRTSEEETIPFYSLLGIFFDQLTALVAFYCHIVLHKDIRVVMEANVAKLAARYPGKFTQESANNRDKAAEEQAVAAVIT